MKRAGIITLVGYFNYGQRLQNYAVTKLLKKLDYEVATLCFRKPKNRNYYLKRFTEKLIKLRHVYDLKILNDYDLVVVGSDQVFNWKYLRKTLKRKFNLIRAAEVIGPDKLVALAASFGTEDIPSEMVGLFKAHLGQYKTISVREEAGADIIKRLTGRETEVLVDPVLVTAGWDELASGEYTGDYVFNFFVDGIHMTPRYEDKIKLLAHSRGWRVETIHKMAVKDFLSAIKNARLIVTNSYHGVCFSIIYRTPFVLIEDREAMSSRFDTLFKKLGIEGRKITNSGQLSKVDLTMDYKHIHNRLKDERKKALNYLCEAIRWPRV